MTTLRFRAEPFFRALVFVAMVAPLAISAVVESPVPLATRMEAGLLWMLCLFPGWQYLGQPAATRRPIPFLPLIGLLYGLYYALPPALGASNEHYRIVVDPRRDYDEAVFAALLGWLVLAAGYVTAKVLAPPKKVTASIEVSADKRQWYGLVLMITGLLLEIIRRFTPIPAEIAGTLIFVTTLGWFGSGLLITLAVQNRLTVPIRLITYFGVLAFLMLAVESGTLSGVAFYGTVVVVAGIIGNRGLKVTWAVGIVLAALLTISLRGATDEYRKIVWDRGEGGGFIDRTKLRFSLLGEHAQRDGIQATVMKGFDATSERSANLDVLADVIRRTPREVPYWGGTTYLTLIGSFVPRFLWPDKPTKELGQGFGHRYDYLDFRDEGTSFNFPILVEAYANYGMAGVAIVMWLCGAIYMLVERAVNNPGQGDLLSLAGVVLVIPLTNIESDFSLGFGGLIMNGAALWLVLRTIRGKRLQPSWQQPASSPMWVAPSDR